MTAGPRVLGIDPGTVSLDLCGLDSGQVWLDQALPTRALLKTPERLLRLLERAGPVDLIAGPSGYGLPLRTLAEATEADLRLALLAPRGEPGGIGGLRRLARLLAGLRVPVVLTPGVIHLPTVPAWRKLNRIDLGTADKVASAALGIWDQMRRRRCRPAQVSFILLELGGAFSAGLAVNGGQIVDGVGGTGGPIGLKSAGGWDGEVAFLAGQVEKAALFAGGIETLRTARLPGLPQGTARRRALEEAFLEGAEKTVRALTASVPEPREILLSGRGASDEPWSRGFAGRLRRRLARIAPVRPLRGYAARAKQGAQGAAILADGLAGGRHAALVNRLRIREASGTALDYLAVISGADARRRLGVRLPRQ